MYKKASKLKLRFVTPIGELSTEQLWALTLTALDDIVVELEEQLNTTTKKSYLEEDTKEDAEVKLKFDIALDILKTRVADANVVKEAAETKAHNQKILELIKRKQDSEMEGMSIEELEKQLK